MVRWLVIAAHPDPASFSAWMRDAAIASLQDAGAHVDLIDLYAIDFEPSMSDEEHRRYEEISADHPDPLVRDHIDLIARADAMLFVFPTWAHFFGWDLTVLALAAIIIVRGPGLISLDALLGRVTGFARPA